MMKFAFKWSLLYLIILHCTQTFLDKIDVLLFKLAIQVHIYHYNFITLKKKNLPAEWKLENLFIKAL